MTPKAFTVTCVVAGLLGALGIARLGTHAEPRVTPDATAYVAGPSALTPVAQPAGAASGAIPQSLVGNTMRGIGNGLQGYDPKLDKAASAAGNIVGAVVDRAANAASICTKLSIDHPEMRAHISELFKCRFHPAGYAARHGYAIGAGA